MIQSRPDRGSNVRGDLLVGSEVLSGAACRLDVHGRDLGLGELDDREVARLIMLTVRVVADHCVGGELKIAADVAGAGFSRSRLEVDDRAVGENEVGRAADRDVIGDRAHCGSFNDRRLPGFGDRGCCGAEKADADILRGVELVVVGIRVAEGLLEGDGFLEGDFGFLQNFGQTPAGFERADEDLGRLVKRATDRERGRDESRGVLDVAEEIFSRAA